MAGGLGIPDTYTAGDAPVISGFTIDYDSGTTLAGGGLGIANGGSLTIDGAGSVLTQLVNTQAIRVGEGSGGAGTGTGTLTIQIGGAMNTGLAVGLAVGSQIGGGVNGNGVLNVISGGTLTMGTGATAGGLGVGLDGSTGVLNVGNGSGTSTVDLRTNGVLMAIGANNGFGGGNGTLTIDSTGVIDFGTNAIYVGQGSGSVGTVTNAGTIGTGGFATGEVRVGGGGGSGTFTQTAGSLTTTGELNIGVDAGSVGTVTISGSTVNTHQISVGRNGGTGTLTMSSNVTTTGNNASVIIGNGGNGDLYISGGTLSVGSANNSNLEVGNGAGSLGHVHQTGGTVSYGSWVSMGLGSNTATAIWDISAGNITSSAGFEVGSDGVGTMNISGTANIATAGYSLGLRNGSLGTVNMTGGAIASTGQVVVGGGQSAGTGVFNISAGTVSSVNETRVGEGTGATGTLNISGTTAWTSGGELQVGNDAGTGTMNMSGGTMTINQWGAIGRNGGTGILNLSGGTVQMAGGNRTFDIGVFGGNGNPFGTGTMNQSGGALINTVNQTTIGRDASGVGIWNISAGTATLTGQNLVVGNSGQGTLNITGGSITGVNQLNVAANGGSTGALNMNAAGLNLTSREFYVGNGGGGVGTVNVNNGTLQTNEWTEVGRNGGTGTVNISGPAAVWNIGTVGVSGLTKDTQIGYNGGTGNLNVSNGGKVNHNWWFNVARGNGSTGHITVDGAGSTINMINGREDGHGGDNNAQLNVGEDGVGTLSVTNGGTFNQSMFLGGGVTVRGGGEVHIGRNGGSTGTVTVDGAGSTFNTFAREFRVADNNSTGTLNITNGGVVNFASHRENGSQADGNFGVAESNAANGTVNLNNGTLNVTAWALFTGWNNTASTATINMANNSHINIMDDGTGNGRGHLFLGDAGTSTLNQEGGSISAQGWSAIGRERGGNSTYNLGVAGGGGTFTVGGAGGNELYVGRQSHGTIVMGVGTAITVAGTMNLAHRKPRQRPLPAALS